MVWRSALRATIKPSFVSLRRATLQRMRERVPSPRNRRG
ncbi:hypothetical protein B1M_02480 [Burkholderia sp. TJI49]|nr:hypothetical protein B1M_02480 [Burkholderia sp. TJI49]